MLGIDVCFLRRAQLIMGIDLMLAGLVSFETAFAFGIELAVIAPQFLAHGGVGAEFLGG